MLTSIGITEKRYVELKQHFGLPPKCKCAAREKWLNEVSEYAMQQWNIPLNKFKRIRELCLPKKRIKK